MPDPYRLHTFAPAPVREENPRITVITGLEGPVVQQQPDAAAPEPALHADADTDADTEGGAGVGEVGA